MCHQPSRVRGFVQAKELAGHTEIDGFRDASGFIVQDVVWLQVAVVDGAFVRERVLFIGTQFSILYTWQYAMPERMPRMKVFILRISIQQAPALSSSAIKSRRLQ